MNLDWLLVTPDFGRSDAWHFSFVTKFLLGISLHQNKLPIWNSTMGAGFPLIGEGQIGAFYLPNILLFRLFDPVIAYNLALILAMVMLGWGMYLWLRLMHYKPLPSLFAAATLTLSGMVITQLPHIALIQGFSLFPWIAAVTVLLSQKKTTVILSLWAILVSQQLLAGFPQASFITVLFVSCYYLWLIKDHQTKLSDIVWYAVAALLSLGLSAIQLFPSWEFLSQSSVAGGLDPQTASYFSYPLKHILTLIAPFALGNPKVGSYPAFTDFDGSIFWENVGGIGLLPIVLFIALIILSLGRPPKQGSTLFFIATTLFSLLLMLGKYSPLYLIYSFFPFNLFRVPSRFIWIFIPSILLLATEAWTKLWQISKYKTFIRTSLIAAAVTNTVFLLYSWYPYHAIEPASEWLTPPPSVRFVKSEEGRVITIGAEAVHNRIFLSDGWTTPGSYQFLRNALAPDINALWNVPSAQVYAGRFLRRPTIFDELLAQHLTADENAATVSATGKKLLDLLSVKTILTALPLTHAGLVEAESWENSGQRITAWTNPNPLARVYLATQPVVATTKEQAFMAITSDNFIPGKSVIVEQPVTLEPPPNERRARVTILPQEKETELTIRIEQSMTRTVLVITDTYYPGWVATIDGNKAPIFPVNIRQMGILIPAGDHDVQLNFIPSSLLQGAAVSSVTFVFLIGLMVFPFFSAAVRTHQATPWRARHHPRNHDR